MIELAVTICALTFLAPYYDCSEEWDIFVYDDLILKCGNNIHDSLGCASYDRLMENDRIELVQNYAETSGMHTPKLKHKSILWHELLHLMCECDWHERWDNDKTQKRRFYQPPQIPEVIKPHLEEEWLKK